MTGCLRTRCWEKKHGWWLSLTERMHSIPTYGRKIAKVSKPIESNERSKLRPRLMTVARQDGLLQGVFEVQRADFSCECIAAPAEESRCFLTMALSAVHCDANQGALEFG